jgi:transposase-like protein
MEAYNPGMARKARKMGSNRKPPPKGPTDTLRTHEGGSRHEYPQESKERVVREVLAETYTVLEAARRYGLTTAQVHAWIGQAVTQNWGGIRDAFLKARVTDGQGAGGPRMESILHRMPALGVRDAATGDTSSVRALTQEQIEMLAKLADVLGRK